MLVKCHKIPPYIIQHLCGEYIVIQATNTNRCSALWHFYVFFVVTLNSQEPVTT